MKKAPNSALRSNRKRYSSPSSTWSSLELETSLLSISGWEEGGHFSLNGEDGKTLGSQIFVDDSYEA
jgi:hypothetical protein